MTCFTKFRAAEFASVGIFTENKPSFIVFVTLSVCVKLLLCSEN